MVQNDRDFMHRMACQLSGAGDTVTLDRKCFERLIRIAASHVAFRSVPQYSAPVDLRIPAAACDQSD
jgi:hypothetical protein